MALDVGSAVMSFVGDTTNLDEAFTRLVNEADKSMSAAAGSVGKFTDSLNGIEPVLANSKSDVDSWNEEVMRAMGQAGQGVKIFSSEAVNGGDKMNYSFREARGGIMLLSEEVGVHLPRELTMLLAHIMPVGIAFETMLPILGVVAAIKVIGDLIDKHEKLAEAQRHHKESTESLLIKQNDLVLSLHAANLRIEDQIAKLEGRPDRNQLAIALIEVKVAADNLASSFAADFSKMDAELEKQNGLWANMKNAALAALAAATPELVALKWEKGAQDQIAANYLVQESTKQVTLAQEKLNEARRRFADIDPTKDAEAWKAAAGAVAIAAGNVQSVADGARDAIQKVKPEAHDLLAVLTDKAITASAEWKAMGEQITKVGAETRRVHDEIANKNKEAAAKTIETEEAAAKHVASIAETVGAAKIKTWAALAIYEASFNRDSSDTILKIKQDAAEKEYQLKLKTLQKEAAAEAQAASGFKASGNEDRYEKQIQAVQQTNAKIEALNAEHYAKEKQMAEQSDEALLKLRADWAVAAISLAKGLFPNLPEDTKNVLSMADAAARLGVVLSSDLKKSAADAAAALKVLDMEYKAGQISLRDLQQAQMAALRVQIEYDKEIGLAPKLVKAEQDALDKLTKSFDTAYGSKARGMLDTFFADFKKKAKETDTTAQQMGQIVANSAIQMQHAFESAMASAILSQTSFGAALEKGTAQVLAQLSAQAAVQAIYSLALGFLKSAEYDFVGADLAFTAAAEFGILAVAAGAAAYGLNGAGGGGSGSSRNNVSSGSNPGGVQQSGYSSGGSQQVVNVTHLAAGGLVTGPTLAMIGENGPEPVIPLTDPAVMERLANALLSPSTLRAASAGMASSAAAASASGAPAAGFDASPASRTESSSGGGDTHNHFNFPRLTGIVSPDVLTKVMKQMSDRVLKNQSSLHSSNSLRITRRSQ